MSTDDKARSTLLGGFLTIRVPGQFLAGTTFLPQDDVTTQSTKGSHSWQASLCSQTLRSAKSCSSATLLLMIKVGRSGMGMTESPRHQKIVTSHSGLCLFHFEQVAKQTSKADSLHHRHCFLSGVLHRRVQIIVAVSTGTCDCSSRMRKNSTGNELSTIKLSCFHKTT